MKMIKKLLKLFLLLIIFVVVVAAGYVGYILLTYSRIADNQVLEVNKQSSNEKVELNTNYTITTYNIGFGAYSQDYTFFLDSGVELDGTPTAGYYSTAKSKDEALFNTNGAIETIDNINPDFAFFQEVDTDSTRSHHINQYEMIKEKFLEYDSVHASNFHSAFLAYPFYDMHGIANAGISTFSKYKIQSGLRKSFTISTSLSKFFDLDRCFSISEVNVSNNKKLCLVNVHMSAYDEGGVIRAAQRKELNDYLEKAYNEGHYVIVGGDFNHDLLTYNPEYSYTTSNIPFNEYINQRKPEWLQYMFTLEDQNPVPNNYSIVATDNAPTCRGADVEWEIGKGYATTIDGFILSSNIEVVSKETIVTTNGNKGLEHFAYSDHDPVKMTFKLI